MMDSRSSEIEGYVDIEYWKTLGFEPSPSPPMTVERKLQEGALDYLSGDLARVSVVIEGVGEIGQFKKREIQDVSHFFMLIVQKIQSYNFENGKGKAKEDDYYYAYKDRNGDDLKEIEVLAEEQFEDDEYVMDATAFLIEVSKVIASTTPHPTTHKEKLKAGHFAGTEQVTVVVQETKTIGTFTFKKEEIEDMKHFYSLIQQKVRRYEVENGLQRTRYDGEFQNQHGKRLKQVRPLANNREEPPRYTHKAVKFLEQVSKLIAIRRSNN